MTLDLSKLIHKLRNAPRKVGTFGRGDPKPLDEFAPLMTGEERDWLVERLQIMHGSEQLLAWVERLHRARSIEERGA